MVAIVLISWQLIPVSQDINACEAQYCDALNLKIGNFKWIITDEFKMLLLRSFMDFFIYSLQKVILYTTLLQHWKYYDYYH